MVFLTMHSSQENARFRLKPGMKLGLLVLERRQERCLDFAWAQEMRARCHAFVKALCRDEGHAMIALNGPDERVADDRTLRASLERARASCDVVVATQPTSADGALAAVLAQHCALPVVFWATPENFEVVGSPFGGISSKSLVGVQDFAAAFRPGQEKRAKFPTSKAPISAVFHSFRLIFGRAIISRNGLEA